MNKTIISILLLLLSLHAMAEAETDSIGAARNSIFDPPQEEQVFYYHKDHLGSTLCITDRNGQIVERSEYIPYGEVFIDNLASDAEYETPYKFTGKEYDEETGLYYYGARYLHPKYVTWLSVDPLAIKYPNVSPYTYCMDNPVNTIDPDGKKPTLSEAARIAAHVYGDKSDKILTGGWKKSKTDFGVNLNTSSGLCSAIYERTINGKTEYVYATAGTQDMKDVKTDILQPLGLSKQYSQAAENAMKISRALGENAELNYVGHSLGGGEAALNSIVTSSKGLVGREAITFNAAYVTAITKAVNGNAFSPFKSEDKITAYVMMLDPLNRLTFPANGRVEIIYPNNWNSVYNGHSMDNILRCLNTNPNPQ